MKKKQLFILIICVVLVAVIIGVVVLVRKPKTTQTVTATPIPGTIQIIVDGEVKDSLKLTDLDTMTKSKFILYTQSFEGVPIQDIVNKYLAEGTLNESSTITVVGVDGKTASVTWGALATADPGLFLMKTDVIYRLIGEAPGLYSQDAWIGEIVSIQIATNG